MLPPRTRRTLWLACSICLAALWPPTLQADDEDDARPRSQRELPVRDDDVDPAHSTPDPTPPVPNVLAETPRAERLTVVEQAGVGGPLAYASATVLEVGGSGAMSVSGERLYLRMAPFVAWFVVDGFRLSYMHELYVSKVEKDYRISTALVLGGDVHFRLSDRLLIGTGPEVGALYNGDKWGVLIRPKVTLDILIGRSGILHPGLFFSWSSVDIIDASGQDTPGENIAFGFDIAYAAMF